MFLQKVSIDFLFSISILYYLGNGISENIVEEN